MRETLPSKTPNQIVAYNLARARELRGWTQEEAAERLELHIGSRWSKATFSTAERSFDGSRVRQFQVDDVYALARAFDLPVLWFMLPPDKSDAQEDSLSEEDLNLLFGLDPAFIDRLAALLASLAALPSRDLTPDPSELRVDAVRLATRQVVEAALESELAKVEHAGDVLQEIADGLRRTEARRYEMSTELLRRLKEF